jgi:hypothetical protein
MNLATAANAVKTALSYAPSVSGAVSAIESIWGKTVPGSTKKALVMASIQAAAKVGESVSNPEVQVISFLVDEIAGVLFPAAPAQTAAAPAAPAPVPAAPPAK